MPDWFTHTLIGWITGKTTKTDISLTVIGSLLPDLVKITLLFEWLKIPYHNLFYPLHTPIGSILVALFIACFFTDIKKAFIPLTIGLTTHFILDFFLINVSEGMRLLYPFSWQEFQYPLIRGDDYFITLYAISLALLTYCIYRLYDNYKQKKITTK